MDDGNNKPSEMRESKVWFFFSEVGVEQNKDDK